MDETASSRIFRGGAPVVPYGLSREQQVQAEIYYRQKALRDAAVGVAQQMVNRSGAALYAIGMGTGKGAYVDPFPVRPLYR